MFDCRHLLLDLCRLYAFKSMLKCVSDNAKDFPVSTKLVPKWSYIDDMLLIGDTFEKVEGSLLPENLIQYREILAQRTVNLQSEGDIKFMQVTCGQLVSFLGLVCDTVVDELCFKKYLDTVTDVE